MLKFLLEKEFKQVRRSPIIPRLLVIMPVMMLIILPWAADMDIKKINLTVVDSDHSPLSSRLTRKSASSGYFQLVSTESSFEAAMERQVEPGNADVVLEIPRHFERDLMRQGMAPVMISANAVNATKGVLGGSYLARIVADFSAEMNRDHATHAGGGTLQASSGSTGYGERPSSRSASTLAGTLSAPVAANANVSAVQTAATPAPQINIVPRSRFNPTANYHFFMVPALIMMLLTLLCGVIPAVAIVQEKENGTIEQINVTPVTKFKFIFAKLVPFWVIGYVELTVALVVAWLLYGLIPAGSLLTLYAAAGVYILAVSGLGLMVSNSSSNMQQSMFVAIFFMIIFLLMSGLFTPVDSMPHWAQIVTIFNPLKYFAQIMRMVYLKGSTLADMRHEMLALVAFAVGLNTFAILTYRKRA